MKPSSFLAAAVFLTGTALAAGPPPLPSADKPGSADDPLLKRFEGALILQYETASLDEVTLPLAKLEPVPGKRNRWNNAVAEPKKKKTVEGEVTHLLYVIPAGHSSLEVLRSYTDQIKAAKGKILYECKAADCGGKTTGNSLDGGSNMSLAMYLRDAEKIKEEPWKVPWCASHVPLGDVRYVAAELPAAGAHLSVMTAGVGAGNGGCGALDRSTIALVDVIKAKPKK